MKIENIVDMLRQEACKSDMNHKHACLAIKQGNIITPSFHNYMRSYIFNYKCGSAHAEMATVNYLINSLWKIKWRKKQQCVLQTYT